MTSAFGCNCSTAVPDDYAYDDFSKYTVSTIRTHSTTDSDESEVLNTSYKKATPLFRAIEKEDWQKVLLFLTTGKWTNSILSVSNEHLKSPAPSLQVKTWVTSYDIGGIPEWSQLPLHAAISYSAPIPVIKKLVEMYPKSIQCTDNEGMLPIHLAYGFGAPEAVLALLLEPFPSSINEQGLGGRYPYECCELGPNKIRGQVYRIVVDQISNRLRNEVDKDWRKFAIAAATSLSLPSPDVEEKTLTEFILELVKERKQLQDMIKASHVSSSPRRGRTSRTNKSVASGRSFGTARTFASNMTVNDPSTVDTKSWAGRSRFSRRSKQT